MIWTLNSIERVSRHPKLTVVGAGPGDPELITLKAIKAISTANVILYDALVNSELLKYASSLSEKIFVGKRRGCYSYQQEQINDLIVAKAQRHGHVVRLKGGDSFVFGRGSEEIDFAIATMASQVEADFADDIPVFIGVLNGSFMVVSDFLKHYKKPCEVSFIKLSSYEGTSSTNEIKQLIGVYRKEILEEMKKHDGTD